MEQFIPHNTKLLLPIVAERNGSVYNHQAKDGTYKCTLLKTKGQRLRVSVQHKQSNMAKTIQYVPKDSKINVQLPADAPKHVIGRFFNWDPIIDGAAGLGAGFAPEMLPFILAGKEALKHWLHKKSEKKHKKGHKEGNFERAFEGGESNRSMNPIQDLVKHMNAMTLSDQSRKRKASEIDVGALAAQRHHTLHTVNGNLHVRSFDGKSIPLNENEAWIAQHSAHLNSSPRYKPDEVVVQDNLRQIVEAKVQPYKPEPSFNTDGTVAVKEIKNFAKINPKSSIRASSIPVLQGDMGSKIEMSPVTITKTEDHAVIAGSELLNDLFVPTNSGLAGLNVFEQLINPREFIGTKLAYEAQTWLEYRFRKIILEYCPTVGSGQNGAFIGYFTQDPNEQPLDGLSNRRNAIEHEHSVPFQPFSYVTFAMGAKPQDHVLYYMDADAGDDDRLSYQGKFFVVNNGQNTENLTYGTVIMHYECDFYFPAISDAVVGSGPVTTLSFTNDPAPVVNTVLTLQIAATAFTGVMIGKIYQGFLSLLPTNGSNCIFYRPTGPSVFPKIIQGQMYLLKCFQITSGTAYFMVYDTLSAATSPSTATPVLGALYYNGTMPTGSASWSISQITLISPTLFTTPEDDKRRLENWQTKLDEMRQQGTDPIWKQLTEDDESSSSSDSDVEELGVNLTRIRISETPRDIEDLARAPPRIDTPRTLPDLSRSEADIVALHRRVAELRIAEQSPNAIRAKANTTKN